VRGLLCDLTKAFDCVNHETLLAKLEFYGINGVVGKLIKSYLTDIYQRTLITDNTSGGVSEWQNVQQGSILGPLLFLVYTNNFPCIINKLSKQILYTDDTSICFKSKSKDIVIALKEILE
jgi:hypothetical protein